MVKGKSIKRFHLNGAMVLTVIVVFYPVMGFIVWCIKVVLWLFDWFYDGKVATLEKDHTQISQNSLNKGNLLL